MSRGNSDRRAPQESQQEYLARVKAADRAADKKADRVLANVTRFLRDEEAARPAGYRGRGGLV
jgi:chemotaxis methyl-accepting protein methylase